MKFFVLCFSTVYLESKRKRLHSNERWHHAIANSRLKVCGCCDSSFSFSVWCVRIAVNYAIGPPRTTCYGSSVWPPCNLTVVSGKQKRNLVLSGRTSWPLNRHCWCSCIKYYCAQRPVHKRFSKTQETRLNKPMYCDHGNATVKHDVTIIACCCKHQEWCTFMACGRRMETSHTHLKPRPRAAHETRNKRLHLLSDGIL